ncbi:hypothetical protein LEP1GSC132_3990 [Leptospira kirschneri str. 200803703]|nr:hypothetical protein LEP1GSC132_3990 [Leptospira kirschneri str. 200803703]
MLQLSIQSNTNRSRINFSTTLFFKNTLPPEVIQLLRFRKLRIQFYFRRTKNKNKPIYCFKSENKTNVESSNLT